MSWFLPNVGEGRYHQLDTLRFFFALAVVFHHISVFSWMSSLGLAVDFFFILSGFVLTPFILKTKIGYGDFVWRRIARMYPLHFVTLIAILLVYLLTGNGGIRPYPDGELLTFTAHLFLLQNMGFNDHLSWNWPSWSISVEFWLNILLLYFLVSRRMIITSITITIASFAILYATKGGLSWLHTQQIWDFVPSGLIRCAGGLALGYLCYEIFLGFEENRTRNPSRKITVFILSSIAEISLIALAFWAVAYFQRAEQFIAIPVLMVLVIVFSFGNGLLSQLLSIRILAYLGNLSYAVYLIHGPLIILSRRLGYPMGRDVDYTPERLIIFFGALFLFSVLSYHLIEMPGKKAVMSVGRVWLERARKTHNY
ncbi:acyltransferase family protein [Maricaulis sp. D1M11]|uniref:acyltransferase family protein n=1 Tax=Maricaulis sp. D1M11 TaxID=3076117 RepID=UPI0039B4E9DB